MIDKRISQLMNMKGRVVLITGAAGFLGRMVAHTLAELGAELILVDLPTAETETLGAQIRDTWGTKVVCITCDLELESSRNELIAAVLKHGRGLNCLINNAAFVGSKNLAGWSVPFEEQSLETWQRALTVNLTAAFHLSQAFSPMLKAATGGNIINTISIYGEFGPDWRLYDGTELGNPAAYASSKGGLAQLTRWLATTLAPHVRVNAISPGGVYREQPQVFVERYVQRTPLKRMATEEDFIGAFMFLASDLSGYVTGQVLSIDGGWGVW